MSSSFQFQLEKVAEIRALLGSDDPELLHDAIEGQTDLFEIVDWLLGKLADEEEMEEAIASRVKRLGDRKTACQNRQQRLRDALLLCMTVSDQKSLRRPDATVSVAKKKIGIASIHEEELPDVFFREKREVNREELKEPLAAGVMVPGVVLDNGGISLTVRRV